MTSGKYIPNIHLVEKIDEIIAISVQNIVNICHCFQMNEKMYIVEHTNFNEVE